MKSGVSDLLEHGQRRPAARQAGVSGLPSATASGGHLPRLSDPDWLMHALMGFPR